MSDTPTRKQALIRISGALTGLWAIVTAAFSGAFVLSPLANGREEQSIAAGKLSALKDEFRPIRLTFKIRDGWHERTEKRMIYMRTAPDGSPEALSATCTHLGCTVKWNSDAAEFQCPCHGGRFSDSGEVLGGPPPTGLTRLQTGVRDGEVYVTLT